MCVCVCVCEVTLTLCSVSQDHKEEVTCVSFNANDSYVASGSSSGDLVLHSLTTNLSSKAFGHGSNQVGLTLNTSHCSNRMLFSHVQLN